MLVAYVVAYVVSDRLFWGLIEWASNKFKGTEKTKDPQLVKQFRRNCKNFGGEEHKSGFLPGVGDPFFRTVSIIWAAASFAALCVGAAGEAVAAAAVRWDLFFDCSCPRPPRGRSSSSESESASPSSRLASPSSPSTVICSMILEYYIREDRSRER